MVLSPLPLLLPLGEQGQAAHVFPARSSLWMEAAHDFCSKFQRCHSSSGPTRGQLSCPLLMKSLACVHKAIDSFYDQDLISLLLFSSRVQFQKAFR